MMNEARVSVGLSATAQGYTAYLQALAYARTRLQGRPLSRGRDSVDEIPIISHPDVRRMLLAQKSYVEGALALGLYCGRLIDETLSAPTDTERDDARLLLEVLTPIAKSWPSQWCCRGQQPGHPSPRWVRLHPGLQRRTALPGQSAQLHPRGHPRHSCTRPSWPQGAHRRRTWPALAARQNPGHDRPSVGAGRSTGWVGNRAGIGGAPASSTPPESLWKDGDPGAAPWLTPRSTSKPSATWFWPGSGCSRRWPRTARPETSMTASALPRGTSFTTNSPRRSAQFDLLDSGDRTTTDLDENWF